MTELDTILDEIIAREGGYVNNPADHGGATNMGITEATLGAWLGRAATIEDVQSMTVATAKAIYTQNYFAKPGLDKLPAAIQPVMLDAAVNSGPGQSVKFLQQVLNDAGYGPLAVDGGIGPATLAAAAKAASAMDGSALSRALVEKRRAFLKHLAVANPSQQQFEKGWMARCDQLEAEYA